MEIEGAGARTAVLTTLPPTKKGPVLMGPPARRPPRLPPQKLARGRAIVLTALRPQERQALRRPPIPLPLLRSWAPRSPSPAPT